MPAFAPGEDVIVEYDPDKIRNQFARFWTPADRNAFILSESNVEIGDSQFGGLDGEDVVSISDTFNYNHGLVVRDGLLFIGGGMSNVVYQTTRTTRLSRIRRRLILGQRQVLDQTQLQNLFSFQGYPVFIEVETPNEVTWRQNIPSANSMVLGPPNSLSISGWIGKHVEGRDSIPIVDADGNNLRVSDLNNPENESFITRNIKYTTENGWIVTQARIPFPELNPHTTRDGFNGIRTLSAITMPFRVDDDGITQADTIPSGLTAGRIEVIRQNINPVPPNFTGRGSATIVSSSVRQIIELASDSDVVQSSLHEVVLRVSRRESIGIENTPSSIARSPVPQLRINGAEFFIHEMSEIDADTAMLTVVSRNASFG